MKNMTPQTDIDDSPSLHHSRVEGNHYLPKETFSTSPNFSEGTHSPKMTD
jgi:hypothetical protein